MGDVHFKRGDRDEAFKHYDEAVRRYAEENLYSNAIAVCRKMLRLDPEHWDAHRLLGELYLEQGFTGEAVGYFLEFATKVIEGGRPEGAVDCLKKIIEAAPGRVKVREELAEVYRNLNLPDEARSELLAAAEIHDHEGEPRSAEELRARAKELGGCGQGVTDEASIEGEGTDRVEIVHRRIGLAHHVPLKIGEVLKSFQEEVKRAIGEEDYQCHYDLGISYLDLGFFDEALAEFEIARKHKDFEIKSIEMAGRCFVEKGDLELAIEELKSGLELEGYSKTDMLGLLYNLASAYEKLGQTDAARKCYGDVCAVDPEFRDVMTRRQEIGERT
jgi:tetratricopeptide (TPR) repeat protein